jgi:hypothetical protein
MDWSSIFSIIMAVLVAIGLPLALRKRKKSGPQKGEELCQHLQGIGVKAYTVEDGDKQEKIGQKRSWGEKSVGIIELKDGNIDLINIIGVASQYGTNYFIDYLVKTPNIAQKQKLKKTRLLNKKSSPLGGKVVGIEWKGDESLAESLNFDYGLEDRLLQSNLKDLKGSIWISPEPEHGYARIRTAYALPSAEAFEAINTIAKHVKLW